MRRPILTPLTPINEKVFIYQDNFNNFCKKYNITQERIKEILIMQNRIGERLATKGHMPHIKNMRELSNYYRRAYVLEYIAYNNVGQTLDIDYYAYRFGSSSKFKNPLKPYFQRGKRITSLLSSIRSYLCTSSATLITICGDNIELLESEKGGLLRYMKRQHGGHYMRGFEVVGGANPHYHILYLSPDKKELVHSSIKNRADKKEKKVHFKEVASKVSKTKRGKDSETERERLNYLDKISTIGGFYDYMNKIGRVNAGQKFACLSFAEKNANADVSKSIRTYGASKCTGGRSTLSSIILCLACNQVLVDGIPLTIINIIRLIIKIVIQSIKIDKKREIFCFWIYKDYNYG